MRFFRGMTLERGFIVLSLLGSLTLLITGFGIKDKLNNLKEYLEDESLVDSVPAVANELQQLSLEYSMLYKAKRGSEFLGQENVESYIRRCKDKTGAEIGQISITHTSKELVNDIFDHQYMIRTQNREMTLGRRNIVTFLRELEKDSQQIRVTDLLIHLSSKGEPEAHEIPPDAWLFQATCTSRQKRESS